MPTLQLRAHHGFVAHSIRLVQRRELMEMSREQAPTLKLTYDVVADGPRDAKAVEGGCACWLGLGFELG